MQMKCNFFADKLCSKSKLFLISVLHVTKDSGECEIIGPVNDPVWGVLVQFTATRAIWTIVNIFYEL